MNIKTRISALLHATLLSLAALLPAHAAAPLPASIFFDDPEFTDAQLSPDGRNLAVTVGGTGKRERLGILTLADMSMKIVGQFSDVDVGTVEWVNNDRLVFNTRDRQVAPGDNRYGPGLFAVNRDGSELRQLASRSGEPANVTGSMVKKNVLPWHTFLMGQRGSQDSSSIYVLNPSYNHLWEVHELNLLRLDTLTGRSQSISHPPNTRQWLLDHKGEPRLVVTVDKSIEAIHYLDPATGAWRKVAEFDAYKGGRASFVPLGFGADGTLYVNTNVGADTASLYRFNMTKGQVEGAPIVSLQGYDFSGSLVQGKQGLLGVHYISDGSATAWFDPALKAIQAKIDAMLPHTINTIAPTPRAESPWLLLSSYSDVQPQILRLYNSDTGKLLLIGGTRPEVDATTMASKELVRYKARDGLEIPAWLTLPKGGRNNLPMVLLVHGGPNVRGNYWNWDGQAQFLASRGYAVLEPEFRGSVGFGTKHFRAGWKQWGLAMQNDLADGTRWAIEQGYADAKRICIAGASYGGYATLMGLVNDPELYQCGINWAGVTDIELLYSWTPDSDVSSGWKDYAMPDLVGDPVKDAAQLKATSPLLQAARITKPLLLAYGSADRRVPLMHGKKFYDAVKAGNQQVEWVLYQDEGHGWSLPHNRVDFWSRVEKFLDKHIGKP